MTDILALILPLFGLIVIGYAAARITKRPIEQMGWLNLFIIYIALPALFFKLLSVTPVEELASWGFIGTNIAVTFAIFVLSFGIGYVVSGRRIGDATIQGLGGAYGNIGYMGPAIAILAFGEQAAVPVALIFCFENVMHFANTPALMALSGKGQQKARALVLGVVRSILFHPFILATIAGVGAAFASFTPPEPVNNLIAYLAQAAAPCALFAMGATLALRPLTAMPVELSYLVPIKLIVHPVLMYLALGLMGPFDPVWVFTAVMLAALPTATNVFVMAQQYGVWTEKASATILLTTVLSVVTVTGLLYAIKTGAMPADPFS